MHNYGQNMKMIIIIPPSESHVLCVLCTFIQRLYIKYYFFKRGRMNNIYHFSYRILRQSATVVSARRPKAQGLIFVKGWHWMWYRKGYLYYIYFIFDYNIPNTIKHSQCLITKKKKLTKIRFLVSRTYRFNR